MPWHPEQPGRGEVAGPYLCGPHVFLVDSQGLVALKCLSVMDVRESHTQLAFRVAAVWE